MGNTCCKKEERPAPFKFQNKPTPDPQNETKLAEKISVFILTPNSAKTAAGTSYLMQVVYEHLPLAQQLDM